MSIIRRIILLFSILFYANISKAYDHSILLLTPTQNQSSVEPIGLTLTWQVSPNVSSSNNLKYVIKVMSIDDFEQIPSSLDNYCSSCTNIVDNIISFQSESGSYIFNVETCNKYIWQVTLIEDIPASTDPDGNPIPASQQILGQSGVNTFTTQCSNNSRIINFEDIIYFSFPKQNTPFVFLNSRNNNDKFILGFKFESPYKYDSNVKIKCLIYDNNKVIKHEFDDLQLYNIVKGLNYIKWDITNLNLNLNEIYTLEVIDAKGKISSLKFKKIF